MYTLEGKRQNWRNEGESIEIHYPESKYNWQYLESLLSNLKHNLLIDHSNVILCTVSIRSRCFLSLALIIPFYYYTILRLEALLVSNLDIRK